MSWILEHDTLQPPALEVHSLRLRTQLISEGWREVPAEEAPPLGYEALTVEQLRDEIRRRNDTAPDESEPLSLSGNKPDLIATLEGDDKAQEADA